MSRSVVTVTNEEVNKLAALIEERARKEGGTDVFITHEDLFKALLDRDNQRIRQMMKRQLMAKGIKCSFNMKGGYDFSIPTGGVSVPVASTKPTVAPPIEEMEKDEKKDNKKTFTDFKTRYIVPMPIFQDVRIAIMRGQTTLIVGEPGCGKSRMLEQIASAMGCKSVRRPLSMITDPGELIGMMQVVAEKDEHGHGTSVTKFVDGLITRGAKEGWHIILDELDNATAAANDGLKQITEEGGVLVVETEAGTKVIEKHPDFRLSFTANTWCYGDSTGLFPNAQPQNQALMSRIRPKFEMDYQPSIERQLIEGKVPEAVILKLYGPKGRKAEDASEEGLVTLIRNTFKEKKIPAFLGMRSILGFGDDYEVYGWHKAFLYHIINDFDPALRTMIVELVKSKIGNWAAPSCDMEFISKNEAETRKNGF